MFFSATILSRPVWGPALTSCGLDPAAGDNATTGSAIARQAGILPAGARVAQPKGHDQLMAALGAPISGDIGTGRGSVLPIGVSGSPVVEAAGGPQEDLLVVDGPDFRRAVLDADGQLRQRVFDTLWPRLRVLARCSPADKYTIVKGANPRSPKPCADTARGHHLRVNDQYALSTALR